MTESSRVLEQAEALLRRVSPEGRRIARRARQRRWQAFMRRVMRVAMAVALIAIAAAGYALFVAPIALEGLLLAAVAMAVVSLVILLWPAGPEPTPETLGQSDLPLLPQRTEEWLERQRPALPAPAARLVDGIGLKLEALAPQLATLDPREPAAAEVRKLLSTELPELISGYRSVPEPLRRTESNGRIPDRQLVEGLQVIDGEIARMTEQLAAGDLHRLATQQRYLEIKYKGDEGA